MENGSDKEGVCVWRERGGGRQVSDLDHNTLIKNYTTSISSHMKREIKIKNTAYGQHSKNKPFPSRFSHRFEVDAQRKMVDSPAT